MTIKATRLSLRSECQRENSMCRYFAIVLLLLTFVVELSLASNEIEGIPSDPELAIILKKIREENQCIPFDYGAETASFNKGTLVIEHPVFIEQHPCRLDLQIFHDLGQTQRLFSISRPDELARTNHSLYQKDLASALQKFFHTVVAKSLQNAPKDAKDLVARLQKWEKATTVDYSKLTSVLRGNNESECTLLKKIADQQENLENYSKLIHTSTKFGKMWISLPKKRTTGNQYQEVNAFIEGKSNSGRFDALRFGSQYELASYNERTFCDAKEEDPRLDLSKPAPKPLDCIAKTIANFKEAMVSLSKDRQDILTNLNYINEHSSIRSTRVRLKYDLPQIEDPSINDDGNRSMTDWIQIQKQCLSSSNNSEECQYASLENNRATGFLAAASYNFPRNAEGNSWANATAKPWFRLIDQAILLEAVIGKAGDCQTLNALEFRNRIIAEVEKIAALDEKIGSAPRCKIQPCDGSGGKQ